MHATSQRVIIELKVPSEVPSDGFPHVSYLSVWFPPRARGKLPSGVVARAWVTYSLVVGFGLGPALLLHRGCVSAPLIAPQHGIDHPKASQYFPARLGGAKTKSAQSHFWTTPLARA